VEDHVRQQGFRVGVRRAQTRRREKGVMPKEAFGRPVLQGK